MPERPVFRTTLIVAVLAIGAAFAGCGDADKPPAKPGAKPAARSDDLPPGRIAFRRYLDDAHTRGAIFTLRTNGTGEEQLTRPEAGELDDMPDWSPDGRLIAFQRCREGGGCAVWTVDPANASPHKVRLRCHLPGCDSGSPAWTPDGRLVVTLEQGGVRTFGGAPQIQESAIVTVDLESGKQRTVYERTHWAGGTPAPQVSPDGRTFLYTRENSARSRPPLGKALFAVRANGKGNHQVASWELGGGDHAVFSPGGAVLFRSFEGDDSKQSDYWTVHADGSHLKQLTHFKPGTLVLSASYSPDGNWIVYASDGEGGNADLFVMRADGKGGRPLIRKQPWDSAPDWSPVAN